MIPSSQILLALLSLPSPPSPIIFELGPTALSYHGLLIALGIAVGTWITARELQRRGYDPTLALGSLFFVIPMGVVGGRLYHVATEYHRYTRNPFPKVLETYDGGLGIYGAVAGGFLGVLLFSWYRGINALTFADAAAPGIALGQAIGRWGNYFNQELFGRPSDLPWAIRITPLHRPTEYADATTFHPTFLYELRPAPAPETLSLVPKHQDQLLAVDNFRGCPCNLQHPFRNCLEWCAIENRKNKFVCQGEYTQELTGSKR